TLRERPISVRSPPAIAAAIQAAAHDGRYMRRPRPLKIAISPTTVAGVANRCMVLPSPPLRLERAQRQEQAQDDEVQVVDDVLGVDDAPGERVEVLGHRD